MITRRNVLLAGGIGLLVAHGLSRGQIPSALRRVGVLVLGSEATGGHLRVALNFRHRRRMTGLTLVDEVIQ